MSKYGLDTADLKKKFRKISCDWKPSKAAVQLSIDIDWKQSLENLRCNGNFRSKVFK